MFGCVDGKLGCECVGKFQVIVKCSMYCFFLDIDNECEVVQKLKQPKLCKFNLHS